MSADIRYRWPPLSAAVLAGGKSSRMGTDKALLPLVDGGPPMLGIVLERLVAVAAEVSIIGGSEERYGRFGVPVVPDLYPEHAALGGILTAITHAAHEQTLVVACDMPFLSLPLLGRMAAEPRDYDVLVPTTPGESRQQHDGLVYHTLHAIYSRTCIPAIERRLRNGTLQVVRFFDDVVVRVLPREEIVRWDPHMLSFFNANSQETLMQARSMATGMEHLTGVPRSVE